MSAFAPPTHNIHEKGLWLPELAFNYLLTDLSFSLSFCRVSIQLSITDQFHCLYLHFFFTIHFKCLNHCTSKNVFPSTGLFSQITTGDIFSSWALPLYQRLCVPPSSWAVRGLIHKPYLIMLYWIISVTNCVSLGRGCQYGITSERVLIGEWSTGNKGERDQITLENHDQDYAGV